ncbi:MAG: 16S rRNA (cytidine(1402)-2'-O)-methyltransferase [Deltaproteobacteria bacterium]|nr:16S rRNA (cytidine(1402)-2'-O)-methyltransferase [Deltaproteobacteria bacterium]
MGKTLYRKREGTHGKAGSGNGSFPEGLPAPREKGDRGAPGTLYVVATPIGNLEDVTLRAIRILKEVSLIAAEDTRRTRILLNAYQISTPLTSLYDQNESEKSAQLLARLESGEDVAAVSDAGTPGISDPGYILVSRAVALGIPVVPIPGAAALIAAISVSGLPMDSFVFLGFLPAKPVRRRELLGSLREEERTLIFYESPHRLGAALEDIETQLGARRVVVSREMTKIHEEFLRGTAGGVLAGLKDGAVKGEVTLLVAGRTRERREVSDAELLAYSERLRQGEGGATSLRDMADRIATEMGVPRRRIYRLLLLS